MQIELLLDEKSRLKRLPDTSAIRHFGTGVEVSYQKRGTRYFGTSAKCFKTLGIDTSAPDQGKSRTFRDPGQFRRDTAPPVIRLKRGAEVSTCKWFGAEVSGSEITTSVQ